MTSLLKIFNDIISKVKEKIPEVLETGLWNNQFDNEEKEISFNFPCIFIEFTSIDWEMTRQKSGATGNNQGIEKEQKGSAQITLHCGFSKLEDETISFTEISEILEKTYFALQGLQGDLFTPLLRTSEKQDDNHDRVIDWQMIFSTTIYQTGEQVGTSIPAGTVIPELTLDLDIDNQIIRTGDGL